MTIRNIVSRRLHRRVFEGHSRYFFYGARGGGSHIYTTTRGLDNKIIIFIKRKI